MPMPTPSQASFFDPEFVCPDWVDVGTVPWLLSRHIGLVCRPRRPVRTALFVMPVLATPKVGRGFCSTHTNANSAPLGRRGTIPPLDGATDCAPSANAW